MLQPYNKRGNRNPFSALRVVLVIISLFIIFRIWSKQSYPDPRQWHQEWKKISDTTRVILKEAPVNTRRVIVYNHQTNHDEVVLPFLEALSAHKDIETTLAVKEKRFGIQQYMDNLAWKKPMKEVDLDIVTPNYVRDTGMNIFLDITCGDDLSNNPLFYHDLLVKTDVTLYCVIHHAERFKSHRPKFKLAKPWIKEKRIRFITLSPHVQKSLYKYWDDDLIVHAPVSVFAPIFSMLEPTEQSTPSLQVPKVPYFAVQGNLEAKRRNYTAIVEQMSLLTGSTAQGQLPKARLMLIGSGTPPIFPAEVEDLIEMRANLDYPDFYNAMAGSTALIPAFASEEYYHTKASSTVAASIIAGTPLLASDKLLAAYSYLPSDLAIVTNDDNSALDGIIKGLEYLQKDPRIRSKTRLGLYRLRSKIIAENTAKLRRWVARDLLEEEEM